jgi:hypothetical protein
MVDLDECVQRALATPVVGPPDMNQLRRRARRLRRKRFTWRVVGACATVSAVAFGVVSLSDQSGPVVMTNPGTTAAPRGWLTVRDDAHGLAISYPRSWHPAAATLTPVLVDPVVPIALGTYRLEPQRLGECDIVPQKALDALGPRDAFIAIYVFNGMATWTADVTRPAHFGPGLPWFRFRTQCTQHVRGRVGSLNFAEHGRRLSVLIAIGVNATSQRQKEIYRILDTLTVKPAGP